MLVEMVAMTSIKVRETITLSWKFVTCLQINIWICICFCFLEVSHLEQEGQESNNDEDCLLEEYAQKVVLNLPDGKNERVPDFFFPLWEKFVPPENYLHFSHTHIARVIDEHFPLLDLVLKKVFLA